MKVTPFAREVKQLRAERRVTVRDLALAVDKSVAYIGKIETEGEIPATHMICKIAHVLKANPPKLLCLARESQLAAVTRKVERDYAAALAAFPQGRESALGNDTIPQGADAMATVISLINMKGGVGKTTLAMQLAHTARTKKMRTLAVDLDPQSNLSQSLLKPQAYIKHLDAAKPTVATLFDDYVPTNSANSSPRTTNINDVIIRGVGHWADSTLDLIPSRLELSRTLKNPYGKERLLAKALAKIQDQYDLIIIDCAPTESVLTDAAYFASRYIIVPIKPEFMATIGLPLLARSLDEFQRKNDDHEIEIAGLVFNHSSNYSSGPEGQQAIKEVNKIAKENRWHVCDNQIRYSASYAKSAREGTAIASTSYARWEVGRGFQQLANEVFELVDLAEVTA